MPHQPRSALPDALSDDARGAGRSASPEPLTWLDLYKCDLNRYRRYRKGATVINILITEQGLWALLHYRVAFAMLQKQRPKLAKNVLAAIFVAWQKMVEIATGISISPKSKIGKGFYIGHFGNIFIGDDVEIGEMCNISQGVTLGVSGRGGARGMPRLGNRVYVGANAVIAGKISIGDDAVIAANSLVMGNVAAKAVMMGVPARMVGREGSHDLLHPDCGTAPGHSSRPASL